MKTNYINLFTKDSKLIVKGITIHNTGTTDSAKELVKKMEDTKQMYLCHYVVDENEVIQTTDESTIAFHTGKGYDFGNRFTLAIEICRSQSDFYLYKSAQSKAIELIKSLMDKYGLSTDDIYFHNDFNINTYCPHKILDHYGNKKEFMRKEFKNGI